MSLAALPVEVVKVYDPRIDVLKDREFVITRGGNKIAYNAFRSSSTGASSMAFNVIPNSRTTFIDRKMFVETTISVVFSANLTTAPEAGFVFVSPNSSAPRSFPLARAIATANATIGTAGVAMQTGDVIDPLLRCMSPEELMEYNSGCPTALDKSQTYECYTNVSGLNVLGSVAQPILENGEFARGVFDIQVGEMIPPAGGDFGDLGVYKQVVSFRVFEPVMLSPFVWQNINHSALIGLQTIALQYNFANNLAPLVWSSIQPVNGVQGKLEPNAEVYFAPVNLTTGAPDQSDALLWVGQITPSPLMDIPKKVGYNYYTVERFPTTGYQKVAYGGTTTLQSNNIQLQTIPSLVLACVRRTKASQKYWHPDCYYKINSTAINFAGGTGILSTASEFNLYQISKKNGYKGTYSQWKGKFGSWNQGENVGAEIPSGSGSLLVLKPAEDFGLADGQAAAMPGAFNFQLSLTVECIDPSIAVSQADYEMVVIIINEGMMSIDVAGNGKVDTNIGIVSEADALKAETKPWLDYNDINGMVGGDFLGSLRNWGKKAASLVHTAADLAPKASSALKSVGLGRGAGLGAGLVGSGMAGGALLSQKSLKDRLKD